MHTYGGYVGEMKLGDNTQRNILYFVQKCQKFKFLSFKNYFNAVDISKSLRENDDINPLGNNNALALYHF